VISVHGSHNEYQIFDDQRSVNVDDTQSGGDGDHIQQDVREIAFADGTCVLDCIGTGEHVARLYLAAFGRSSDVAVLEYRAS
jgi:hypothetical protein